jgi:hypothetical protein
MRWENSVEWSTCVMSTPAELFLENLVETGRAASVELTALD